MVDDDEPDSTADTAAADSSMTTRFKRSGVSLEHAYVSQKHEHSKVYLKGNCNNLVIFLVCRVVAAAVFISFPHVCFGRISTV